MKQITAAEWMESMEWKSKTLRILKKYNLEKIKNENYRKWQRMKVRARE